MKELLKKLKNFLSYHGYDLYVCNGHWILSYDDSKVAYDSIRDIMGLVWSLYNDELAGLDFNLLSDPRCFSKRFPKIVNANVIRSELLDSYLDCASFYMLTSADDKLLQFCITDHYQISFQTAEGTKESWGFHASYLRALENYSCVEYGLEAVRYRINWFAGISEPGEEWEEWFCNHQTLSYYDDKGLLHTSEVWAPRIGSRSIDSEKYMSELKKNGCSEIDFSAFYDNFENGMKFLNCKMLITKF